MSQFGMGEMVLRIDILKLGVSNSSFDDIRKRSFEVVTRRCLRSEFEAKWSKHLKFKRERDKWKLKYMRWKRFEDTWKLEKRNVLHVLNVARSHKSDRYGRSSIYRSLNVRISGVISIVQNSVNIQNTTWLGKRMLEQCTYDCTKPLQFSKTSLSFQFIFIFASTF